MAIFFISLYLNSSLTEASVSANIIWIWESSFIFADLKGSTDFFLLSIKDFEIFCKRFDDFGDFDDSSDFFLICESSFNFVDLDGSTDFFLLSINDLEIFCKRFVDFDDLGRTQIRTRYANEGTIG